MSSKSGSSRSSSPIEEEGLVDSFIEAQIQVVVNAAEKLQEEAADLAEKAAKLREMLDIKDGKK